MKHICFFLAGIFIAAAIPATAQTRIFVDQQAVGANTGASWTDAFTDLHSALATAVAGDEVWVAKGMYLPGGAGDRSARYELLSGVRLYGGFSGAELDLSERDWQMHPTVLDGDIGTPGDSSDNSRNLLYLFRPDSFTLVDGFVFRQAMADDTTVPAGSAGNSGGALYIMANNGEAYPAIRNCIFERNTALRHGGAVYVNGGGSGSVAPVFDNCRFVQNRAVMGSGGGLYRRGGSWVDRMDVIHCTFDSNTANANGGSIFFADSPRTDNFDIAFSTFTNNQIVIVSNAGRLQQGVLPPAKRYQK
jgi:predicted outer membrane repeat protein